LPVSPAEFGGGLSPVDLTVVSVLEVVFPPGVEIVSVFAVFDSSPQPTRPIAGKKRRPRIRADDSVRFMSSALPKERIIESLASGQPHDEIAHPSDHQTTGPRPLPKISEITNRATKTNSKTLAITAKLPARPPEAEDAGDQCEDRERDDPTEHGTLSFHGKDWCSPRAGSAPGFAIGTT
jgi:hypothetical protein